MPQHMVTDIKMAGTAALDENVDLAMQRQVAILTPTWDVLTFFLFIIVVEHALLLLKMIVELAITDVPADVMINERETEKIRDDMLKG